MDWLLRVLKGALIGTGAILPGISGGVMCVALGVYRPMMAFLAHPVKTLRKEGVFLLPVLLGWAVGVVGLARVVGWLFGEHETPAVWLFIGLIVGTFPSLYREAGQKGRGRAAWVAFAISAAAMGAILFLVKRGGGLQLTPSFLWWAVCGVLWGLGLVVPGLSSSQFIIYLGLYGLMSDGIAALDLTVILPLLAGIGATVALLARAITALMARAYAIVFHAILGVVAASTLAIVPTTDFSLWYILYFFAGCAVAFAMDRLGARVRA